MGVHHVLAVRQLVDVEQPGVQPLVVGVLFGEAGLDLLVVDDAALRGVDQEHPARLQTALGHHFFRLEVEHAGLAGQHHSVVGGLPPAGRAQAVAVQHRADQRAVGEGDAGRAVPRLYQARVELVEGLALGVHLGVVLPRLGHHHQHRVRQAPAAQVQQLKHLVEGGRVRAVLGADRVQPRQFAGNQVGGQQRLAGPHPVAVAADRVDLTVVRHVAEWVRQRPRREGVRGKPAVHQPDRADQPVIGEVREERRQLLGGQHALVNQRPAGQRREVELQPLPRGRPLGTLAQAESQPVQLDAGLGVVTGDQQDTEVRHALQGGRADTRAFRRDRHVAPAQHPKVLLGGDLSHQLHHPAPLLGVGGQEGYPGGITVLPGRVRLRQFDVGLGAQQLVRQLEQDARAVAAGGLGTGGTAVLQVRERGQRVGDDAVGATAADVGDHGDTAGILFRSRVVQPLGCGDGGEDHCADLPRHFSCWKSTVDS